MTRKNVTFRKSLRSNEIQDYLAEDSDGISENNCEIEYLEEDEDIVDSLGLKHKKEIKSPNISQIEPIKNLIEWNKNTSTPFKRKTTTKHVGRNKNYVDEFKSLFNNSKTTFIPMDELESKYKWKKAKSDDNPKKVWIYNDSVTKKIPAGVTVKESELNKYLINVENSYLAPILDRTEFEMGLDKSNLENSDCKLLGVKRENGNVIHIFNRDKLTPSELNSCLIWRQTVNSQKNKLTTESYNDTSKTIAEHVIRKGNELSRTVRLCIKSPDNVKCNKIVMSESLSLSIPPFTASQQFKFDSQPRKSTSERTNITWIISNVGLINRSQHLNKYSVETGAFVDLDGTFAEQSQRTVCKYCYQNRGVQTSKKYEKIAEFIKCQYCYMIVGNMTQFLEHKRLHHPSTIIDKFNKQNMTIEYRCRLCEETTFQLYLFYQHFSNQHKYTGEPGVRCEICNLFLSR